MGYHKSALPATNASVPLELRLDVPKDAPTGTNTLTVSAEGPNSKVNLPVAVTIASRCDAATRHIGVHEVIRSQSARPVIAVGTVRQSPTSRASHQALVVRPVETPATARIPRIDATVYAPIVASVNGG